MESNLLPSPELEEVFRLEVQVKKPIVVGQDNIAGRRQLIELVSGKLTGKVNGILLPGGVDSQIIRPDGLTELEARYGIELDNGDSLYIENKGIRRVDPAFSIEASQGKIIDPSHVYFAAVPHFEVYSEALRWLTESVFICYATRLPELVLLRFYRVV